MGLLSKGNSEQIPFAYKVYKSRHKKSEDMASRFKSTFCREVKIDFLGAWFVPKPIVGTFRLSLIVRHRDTIASVGYVYSPATLPFVGTNHVIKVFRHAVSLDEVRTYDTAHQWGDYLTYRLSTLLCWVTFGARPTASRRVPSEFV